MIIKKLLAVIISALLIISVVPFVPFTTFAETEGIYTYRIDYGRAKIINVDKSVSGDIIVPATLGGYPVTAIGNAIYVNGDFGEGWQRPTLTEVNGGSSAFQSCDKITSITIPKSVTKIDSDSFLGCSKLSEIIVESGNPVYIALNNCLIDATTKTIISGCMNSVIPNDDRVTSIDEYSFAGCSGLKSITIPNNITSIGKDAFHSCVGLESLVIGNGITEIKSNTFHDCKNLKSVIWGQSIKTIAKKAFLGCESLENIILPDSVESVEYGAFCDCMHLSSIRLGANLSSIAGWAFCGCSSLGNISVSENNTNYYVTGNCLIFTEWKSVVLGCKNSTIPEDDNVNGVSYVAFAGCEALEEITIPQNIEFIGEEAFEDCINLKTVNMEFGLKVIGHGAFRNCTSLNNIVLPESLVAFGEDGLSPAGGIFMNCKSLQNINIPKGITSIYNEAFSGCSSLISIEIPETVTYISSDSFSGCTSLESITVDKNNTIYTSINNCLISTEMKALILGCKNSRIPNDDSIVIIYDNAFYGCTGLKTITIPDSITKINDSAFENCTELTSVKIPNSVNEIGVNAFKGCTGIESVVIPGSISDITSGAFANCTNLKKVEINYGVTSIGYRAFENCYELNNITIPKSVSSIGEHSFDGCNKLKNIILPESITGIGVGAFNNTGYYNETSNWENDTLYIGNHLIAFNKNSDIENYIVKEGTKTISGSALSSCGFTSIVIPKSVVSIGALAISNCSNLTDIYYTGTEDMKNGISIAWGNYSLTNAVWHYNYIIPCLHSESVWKVVAKATLFDNGLKQEICKKCGDVLKEEEIPALSVTYSIDTAKENMEENISVAPLVGSNLPENAEVKAEKTRADDKQVTFEIHLENCGEVIQPTAPVLVKLPIPDGFDKSKLYIYRRETNGSKTRMDITVDGDFAYFETDHFSIYEIIEKLCGDINNDNKVNNKDLTRLFQYLSNWNVEVNELTLDINGDGKINNKDLTRLFQFLSNWDVEIF